MVKKYGYRILSIIMCTVIVMGAVFTYEFAKEEETGKKAEASQIATEGYTESNPLTVIEVVPYIMYAEFGYHIAGGELADFEQMEYYSEQKCKGKETPNGKDPVYIWGSWCSTDYARIEIKNEHSWEPLYVIYSKEYFKRYSLEVGDVNDELLKKQAVRKRLKREIDSTKDETHKANCEETLKQYTLSSEEQKKLDEFNSVKVVYKAVLVSEVNSNPSMLDNADIIFISGVTASGAANNIRAYLKDEYKKKLKNCPDINNTSNTEYENKMKGAPFSYDEEQCLSWKAADHIFKLSSEVGGVPVVMNKKIEDSGAASEKKQVEIHYTALDENNERKAVTNTAAAKTTVQGCSNNAFKLYLMLYQKDPYVFRNDYYRYINDKGEFTLQSGDAKSYWNMQTFYDYIDGVNDTYNNTANKGQNYTTNTNVLLTNGFTWNSDTSFYNNYVSEWSKINISVPSGDTGNCYYGNGVKFSKDVLTEFTTNKITVAEAIKFLLTKRNQNVKGIAKKKLSVLELEPSNEFTIKKSTVKSYLSGYKGTIQMTYMTSAQFNSTKTDLAGEYDLIILGDNTGGLSLSTGNKNTYMKTGDSVKAEAAGATVTTSYSGNDITSKKRQELKEYLNAGRPIIMADSLYGNLNVDKSSNMYAFLQNDISEAKKKNQIAEQSKAEQSPATVTNQLISYLETYRPEVSKVSASYQASSFKVSFTISELEEAGKNATLSATLYAALDGTKVNEETAIGTIAIKKDGQYAIEGNASAIKTADPAVNYRLVVKQEGNAYHYSTHFGVAKRNNTNVKTIKVLQIAPASTTIDLTKSTDTVGKLADQVKGEKIEVTKMTVDQFTAKYASTPYDSSNILTDQLLAYDVVVFGFSSNYPVISNANGALDNVIDFIGYHRSVIFTNGVLQPVKASSGTKTQNAYTKLRELAGMKQNAYSYAYLNSNKKDSTNYTMYNCSGGSAKENTADHATLVNSSPVSSYPYQVTIGTLVQKTTKYCEENSFASIPIKNEKTGCYQADLAQVNGYYALANKDEGGRKQFSSSPNDMNNNYYLCQNGTVWYSGIGCNTITSSEEEEAKLFVNTIVGAYHSMPEAPTVAFTDTNKDGRGNDTVYVDADVFSSTIEDDKRLTFIPYDASGAAMDATVLVKTNGTIYKILEVTEQENDGIITLSGSKLTSDTKYDMKVEAANLNGSDIKAYVYVENANGVGMASCQIVRRNEFDLD